MKMAMVMVMACLVVAATAAVALAPVEINYFDALRGLELDINQITGEWSLDDEDGADTFDWHGTGVYFVRYQTGVLFHMGPIDGAGGPLPGWARVFVYPQLGIAFGWIRRGNQLTYFYGVFVLDD